MFRPRLSHRMRSALASYRNPEPVSVRSAFRPDRSTTPFGGLTQGGIVNYQSGLGTNVDKTEAAFFEPTRIYSRQPLEILYVQSWAARNYIDIPIDDMFIRWRKWKDEPEGIGVRMREAERKWKLTKRLKKALKASRAMGTSLLMFITREAPLHTPLELERIREGDLAAIRVFDRFDCSVSERDADVDSENFGMPTVYDVHPKFGAGSAFRIHHSRVVRFDGIESVTDSGLSAYGTEDWALSLFIPVIISILQDQSVATAIAHMSQEASLPVLKIANLREVIAGRGKKEVSAEAIGGAINRIKSVFRLMMLDKDTEDFTRVTMQFSALPELMDRYHARLAAAAQIPETRFLGRSPAGMNSTGESDMRNYNLMVEANRAALLDPVMHVIDAIIGRSEGIREIPEFDWLSLLEMSDRDKAETSNVRVNALHTALHDQAIDEDEYRDRLDGDPVFGELPGEAPVRDDEIDPLGMPGPPTDSEGAE